MISHLLEKTTLLPEEYVLYEPEQMRYKSTIYSGAKSRSFLRDGWQIITLERLFHNFFGESLYVSIFKISDHEKRLRFLVEQVERITGLSDFGIYMNKLFTVDTLFLNEDRHTHNIVVLMNEKGKVCILSFFDHGAGLLSDTTMDYPMNGDIYELMNQVEAKTISGDFDEQLDISERFYHTNIKFDFTAKDVEMLLKEANMYSIEEKARVEQIL